MPELFSDDGSAVELFMLISIDLCNHVRKEPLSDPAAENLLDFYSDMYQRVHKLQGAGAVPFNATPLLRRCTQLCQLLNQQMPTCPPAGQGGP